MHFPGHDSGFLNFPRDVFAFKCSNIYTSGFQKEEKKENERGREIQCFLNFLEVALVREGGACNNGSEGCNKAALFYLHLHNHK